MFRRQDYRRYMLMGSIPFVGLLSLWPAQAQISSDGTLPTQVSTTDQRNFAIANGQQIGRNLFHSFDQFNIPTAGSALFDHSPKIANIITRVTGTSSSSIDGLIQTNGAANLFFLNPNGIVFGPQASLNIGGAFIASSATSFNFADGTQFSTRSSQVRPPLTVSVPVGLQFGATPGKIINQSRTTKITNSPSTIPIEEDVGLQTSPGQVLALLGGEVIFDGGLATAPGGLINLGSVASNSVIALQPQGQGWTFDYQQVASFQDIHLSDLAAVNASGLGGGQIHLHGRTIRLSEGSKLFANTLGSADGGGIVINAAESVQVLGTTSIPNLFEPIEQSIGIHVPLRSEIATTTFGAGKAGDITINTQQLLLRNGGQITATAFAGSMGQGGNLTVNATDAVKISGISNLPPQPRNSPFNLQIPGFNGQFFLELNAASALGTVSGGTGASGRLTVNTGQLTVQNGGVISTSAFNSGSGGQLTVNAFDFAALRGTSPSGAVPSGLFSPTLSAGNAGNTVVNTRQLQIDNGARIAASTLAAGQGGNISIEASDTVILDGIAREGDFTSGLFSQSFGTGNAGSLEVKTRQIDIRNGASIAVDSRGSSLGGTIRVKAQKLSINNDASISAETDSGQGGNIQLDLANRLLLQGSNISATAGRQQGSGDGGNINVDTTLLIAAEESNIAAEAFSGMGGNIKITTQGGLFLAPDSSISASSQLDNDGTVTVDTPETDPSNSTAELPESLTIPPRLAQGCRPGQTIGKGQFIHAGRGGLPLGPTGLRTPSTVWEDIRHASALPKTDMALNTSVKNLAMQSPQAKPIVEAKAWVPTLGGLKLVAPVDATAVVAFKASGTC